MKDGNFQQWVIEVMSGRTRGVGARLLRAALGAAEPVYVGAATARNRRFDRSTPTKLGRPVISVGNLTTGGTGKTPAVQWLVRSLLSHGYGPGILLRGYGKRAGEESDEERLLRDSLGVPVVANPDRVSGAAAMLKTNSDVDVFVLDDGFQHRRVARDLDIVLIDATNPFGFDHVLPRGLLREPASGLSRAGLIIITRAEHADDASLTAITVRARGYNSTAPIIRSTHQLTHALDAEDEVVAMAALRGRNVFAVSGLGNPAAFEKSLVDAGMLLCGVRRFADHHAYVEGDVAAIIEAAGNGETSTNRAADCVVTTEKDWTKLRRFASVTKAAVPFLRTVLRMSFTIEDEAIALKTVTERLMPRM